MGRFPSTRPACDFLYQIIPEIDFSAEATTGPDHFEQ